MPGLQGPFCDMPFCKVQPCKNGFCLSGEPLQPPKCQCSIGYTGKYCEIEINECESQPCQNNGQCIDSIGSFECNCTNTGFNGVLCENDIDECVMERISCGGKGLCINTRGSFKCQCPEDTCGPNCDQVDMCAYSDICQNGGVCIEDCKEFESDYICNCTEEFTGKNCTESVSFSFFFLILKIIFCLHLFHFSLRLWIYCTFILHHIEPLNFRRYHLNHIFHGSGIKLISLLKSCIKIRRNLYVHIFQIFFGS